MGDSHRPDCGEPHATAYARAGAPAAMARIARVLDAEDAAAGRFDLVASLGAKQSLAEVGLREIRR